MPSEGFYDNSHSEANKGASNVSRLDDYRRGGNQPRAKIPGAARGEENPPQHRIPPRPPGGVSRDENSVYRLPKNLPGSASGASSPPTIHSWDNNKTALNKIRAGGKYPTSKSGQKGVEQKLKRIQKNAPEIAKKAARIYKAGPVLGSLIAAKDIFHQIDFTKDWLFIPVLISFAAIKDVFDWVFGALAAVPVLGWAAAGVGIVVSFVLAILMFILTATILVLTGSDIKNRAVAKYIIPLFIGFVIEAVPGLDWLPMAIIEVLVVYGLTLFDRMLDEMEKKKGQSGPEEIPQPQMQPQMQYTDDYAAEKAA